MRTLKMTIEYDGADFHGWQVQGKKRTVQGVLQEALSALLKERITVIGSGRTDSGVHAEGQVAHVRIHSKLPVEKIRLGLNALLPHDVVVKEIKKVSVSFHAQNDAKAKTYCYRIYNSQNRPVLERGRVWHVWSPLNVTLMKKTAAFLVGRHDFAAFQATDKRNPRKTTVRHLTKISVAKKGTVLSITLIGEGFLKYMVRNIVGTLVMVGRGFLTPAGFQKILKSRDRKKAGRTAPAHGLILKKVFY